jgi:hypothetical protein
MVVDTAPAVRPEAVPVMFVPTNALGVPRAGVTKIGEVLRTTEPVPVEEVTPVPPFATGSVPETPVVNGKLVQLAKLPEVGVPSTGVVNVGEFIVGELLNTRLPVPVDIDVPEPPLAIGKIPVTPVVKGKPVVLVKTPEVGVPRRGVIRVGEVLNTTEPVPVDVVTPVPPLVTAKVPVT